MPFGLVRSTYLDNAHEGTSKRYGGNLFPSAQDGQSNDPQDRGLGEEEEEANANLLNSQRVRPLAPRDILSRAFAGLIFYYHSIILLRVPSLFYFSFPYLERPLSVSEGAQIFNLGLDDVCALVEASGRTVANKIFEGYSGSIPFPGFFHI